METKPVHERLRQARLARHQNLDDLAERIGIRTSWLQAIEAGQYDTLPHGIYGRAAIRTYADALGFDGPAILSQCEAMLPALEDPIAGLARVRGITRPSELLAFQLAQLRPARALMSAGAVIVEYPSWRLLAAAAIDSVIVLGLLLSLVAATITVFGTPVLSMNAGPAFALVGMLLATSYFGFFGGIGGQTVGAHLAGVRAAAPSRTPIDLGGVLARAFGAAARDVVVVEQFAMWIRAATAGDRSSESRRDTQQAEQPARS